MMIIFKRLLRIGSDNEPIDKGGNQEESTKDDRYQGRIAGKPNQNSGTHQQSSGPNRWSLTNSEKQSLGNLPVFDSEFAAEMNRFGAWLLHSSLRITEFMTDRYLIS
jgi:hypothetical protein